MHISFKSAVSGAMGLFLITPAFGAFTFLHHFNNGNFDINPANGDYAGGDSTATTAGSPSVGTGYFPGSSPINGAYFQSGAGHYTEFNGNDGNVAYTTATTGGITVGAWVKLSGSTAPVSRVFTVGSPDLDDDYLYMDYGNANDRVPRILFRDGGGFSSVTPPHTVSTGEWVYYAATVDLSAATMKFYMYDASGAAIGSMPYSTSIPVSNWNLTNPVATWHRVRIGGPATSVTELWVDEFSIDGTVLSQADISARVASMVAGNQLAVPEPASVASTVLAGLLLARRRCRA